MSLILKTECVKEIFAFKLEYPEPPGKCGRSHLSFNPYQLPQKEILSTINMSFIIVGPEEDCSAKDTAVKDVVKDWRGFLLGLLQS